MITPEEMRTAETMMTSFCQRTGLTDPSRPPSRYLWTDAFAVCNLLGLAEAEKDTSWRQLALDLIDQVHDVLGRSRPGTPDSPRLSGLDEETAREHPTLGGLRIGKALDERPPDAPFDAQLEWERDGQYFHYLTKWMHALARAAETSGDPRYVHWGIELARTAHRAFCHRTGDRRPRLYWKMSIDLTRPLVPSMGQHDALDAWVVYHELSTLAKRFDTETKPLRREIDEAWQMLAQGALATTDPLGIGGLLMDTVLHGRLLLTGAADHPELLPAALQAASPDYS